MKRQKKFNKDKFVYYVRKIITYYGAMNIGSFVAVWLIYGFSFEILLGLVLAILVMVCAACDNKYDEEIEEI